MFVIPWTKIPFLKPQTGQKFTGEDHAGVDQTSEYEVMMTHKAAQRSKQGGESVYGKHPDGSRAWQAEISSSIRMEGGEDHLQKPAQQSAMYIVVNEFFHNIRMSDFGVIIPRYINSVRSICGAGKPKLRKGLLFTLWKTGAQSGVGQKKKGRHT